MALLTFKDTFLYCFWNFYTGLHCFAIYLRIPVPKTLELILAVIGQETEYILDRLPICPGWAQGYDKFRITS